MYTGLLVRCGG